MKQFRDTEYFVSEDGRIFRNDKERKKSLSKTGYEKFCISHNNIQTHHLVHRIVAELYVVNVEQKPCVNHIDGNKTNNHFLNLEWVTYQENIKHSKIILKKQVGITAYQAKLTEENIIYIRDNYIPRHKIFGQNAMARKFDINQKTIWSIIHNKTWVNPSLL